MKTRVTRFTHKISNTSWLRCSANITLFTLNYYGRVSQWLALYSLPGYNIRIYLVYFLGNVVVSPTVVLNRLKKSSVSSIFCTLFMVHRNTLLWQILTLFNQNTRQSDAKSYNSFHGCSMSYLFCVFLETANFYDIQTHQIAKYQQPDGQPTMHAQLVHSSAGK